MPRCRWLRAGAGTRGCGFRGPRSAARLATPAESAEHDASSRGRIAMARTLRVAIACALLGAGTSAFALELGSPDIGAGTPIANRHVFKGFGCAGENVSPALAWSAPPAGAKSFALMVHDPDAPTGGAGWWHWVVYDLPAGTTALAQGAGTAD